MVAAEETDFGAKNTSASLPRRLRLLRRFFNSPCLEPLDSGDPFLEPDTADPATSRVPITLTAGTRYFIMVLYKGSSGGGNSTDVAQVAWRKVGDATPAVSLRPIPGAFLSTLASDAQGPRITVAQQPQNVTAEENSKVTFSMAADVSPTNYVCIQWQRNGVNIPGATGTNYTRFLDKADNLAKFRALVAVPGASTNSAEATATITDDQTRPVLLVAKGGPNRPEVTLTFSERLSASLATNPANYQISSLRLSMAAETRSHLCRYPAGNPNEPDDQPAYTGLEWSRGANESDRRR